MAVVLSAAALAGCGQAPGSGAATTRSGPPTAAGEAGAAGGEEPDGGEGATPLPAATGAAGAGGGAPDEGASGRPSANASGTVREQASAQPPSGDDPAADDGMQPSPPASDAPASVAPGDPDPVDDRGGADDAPVDLDVLEQTVLTLLRGARQAEGAPRLRIDASLVSSARERACAMAHGATPLLAEDDRENIGLVVESDPDAAARAMHDWWMQSSEARDVSMAAVATNYGVGACSDDDHVYYAERFAP